MITLVGSPADVATTIAQRLAELPFEEVHVTISLPGEARRSKKPSTPQELLGTLPDLILDLPLCSLGAELTELSTLGRWGIEVIGDLWNQARSWTTLEGVVQEQIAPTRDRLIALFETCYASCF